MGASDKSLNAFIRVAAFISVAAGTMLIFSCRTPSQSSSSSSSSSPSAPSEGSADPRRAASTHVALDKRQEGVPSTPQTSEPTVPTAPPAAARSLPAPAYLPTNARAILAEQMQRHGDEMSELLWAVVFLDHEAVLELADAMDKEPRLARPLTDDATELNVRLPPAFFGLQDELFRHTEVLAAAARRHDDSGIAGAYADLARTCVLCHGVYLNPAQPVIMEKP
ncbi:MAG: hypothetical protein H6729_12135 [Deltaproteobacteria bacterium]|nr:hypothetical protein [Deltaproteobacteria bacterium]